jgi:hypothetical protein
VAVAVLLNEVDSEGGFWCLRFCVEEMETECWWDFD